MALISDKVILTLQVFATAFMAADYFFDDARRKEFNAKIQESLIKFQSRISDDQRAAIDAVFVEGYGRTLTAILFFIIAMVGFGALNLLGNYLNPWVLALVMVALLVLFVAFLNTAIDAFMQLVVPIGLGIPLKGVATFIIFCKKGSIFGIGFVILVLSFICRYLNLP
ncbi:hypothetical protein [Duganella fentianensis]|uniref:hypothetical protein n=1 Tax=Duganella fentianensis TaxID=2692177 RepID=UPI0032B29447